MPDTVTLIDTEGVSRDVPVDVAQGARAQGWRDPEAADIAQASTQAANTTDYGGAHGAIGAIGAGLARGVTLGGSDVAARIFGGRDAANTLSGLRSENPVLSTGSEILGAAAPAFVTAGAATPAGLTSKLGRSIVEHATAADAGLAARASVAAQSMATEGALYGGGDYLSQVALEDKPLSAEGFVGAMGKGALFAVPVGGAFALGGKALQRARSLFPRSEVTAQAARAVDKEATSALTQAMTDGEQMAQAAERKLSDVDANVGLAQSGETVTRRMFGAADPIALGDQVAGAVDRTQIAKALEDYQASKAQLADWIATEGDPELEAALRGMQGPGVQVPTGQGVPVGEFGARGARGYDPGNVRAPGPPSQAPLGAAVEGTPVTRAMRKAPAPGEPTTAFDFKDSGLQFDPESRNYFAAEPKAAEPDLEALLGATKKGLDDGIPMRELGGKGPAESAASAPVAAMPKRDIEVVRVGRPSEGKFEIRHPDGSVTPATQSEIGGAQDGGWIDKQMPEGFNSTGLETHRDFSIKHDIPARASDLPSAEPNAIYIARPSELADRPGGVWGNELKDANRDRVLKAWSSGEKLRPVDAFLAEDGRLWIEDGNHRIQAAARDDRPVALRIKSAVRYKPQANAEDIAGRIRSDVPKGTPAPATDTLTGLLRGTQEGLAAGKSLSELGAPARAEYASLKAARTGEAAAKFRAKATAGAAADDGGDLMAALQGTKQGLDSGKGLREIGGHAPAEPVATPAPHAVPEAAPPPQDPTGVRGLRDAIAKLHSPEAMPVNAAEYDARKAAMGAVDRPFSAAVKNYTVGKTIVDSSMRGEMAKVSDDEAIARLLGKRVGKDVNMGPGLARAAKAIGDHEAALAGLSDVLGADAPQTVVENAKAYRAAVREQHDLNAASSAKAAADIKNKVQPALDATVVDDKVTQALRQHEARAAAKAPATGAAPTPAGGIGAKLTTAGAALEVLHALGAHVPSVASIPIIGPILSLFFKAKAVMGIIGRKGGSIGQTAEGMIAGKSAITRDRVNAAVGQLLDAGAKGMRKASAFAVPAAAMLGPKLFPGGEEPKGKDLASLYHARMDEIARARAPGAIDAAIGDRIQTGDPALHDAVVAQVQKGISFLDSKAPKQTVMPGVLPGDGTWKPSRASLEEFAKYVHAVHDPASVLEDLAKGHVTMEGAETLRVVYPKLYAEAQRALLERAPQMQATLPYARRVAISIMFGIPVDTTMSASHMTFLQTPTGPGSMGQSVPATPMQGQPAIIGPLQLGQQTMTSLDRRAGA